MTGDDRARHCQRCSKHVYNLSELDEPAIVELLERDVCVSLEVDQAGALVTAESRRPSPRNRVARIALTAALSALAATSCRDAPRTAGTPAPPPTAPSSSAPSAPAAPTVVAPPPPPFTGIDARTGKPWRTGGILAMPRKTVGKPTPARGPRRPRRSPI